MPLEQNLPILRARKNMTQEQLAEQLGVSRQSVSKWESGASFPELNTLLTLCDLFDVSMDDLLRGSVEHSFADDTEMFDRQMQRFSRSIAGGVGLVLLGTAVAAAMAGLGVPENILGMVFLLILVAAVMLLVSAGLEQGHFAARHPQLHLRYTQEEEERFDRRFIRTITVGVGIILAGVAVVAGLSFLENTPWEDLLGAGFLLAVTVAVPPIVQVGILKSKYETAKEQRRREELAAMPEETPEQVKARRAKVLSGRINGCIMLVATAVFLCWSLTAELLWNAPVWHISWIVFVVGGILCGVVSTALGAD